MPIYKDHLFRLGASGASAEEPVYEISNSIRFNDGDTPALKKTYPGAGTEETFTFSCWVKRGNIGASLGGAGNYGLTLFSGGTNTSNYGEIRFESSGYGTQDSLFFYNTAGGSFNMQLATNRLFRDTAAWYHIVCVMDTTNNVSSERLRMYINGQRETNFSAETYPAKDTASNFNTATEHGVGVFAVSTDTRHFDGYLAEIHFLDGYAYGPEYFGVFNSSNIWIPIDYDTTTGNYGTNGFKIDGSDSATLGKNVATGNTYTSYASTNLDTNDQMSDSPNTNWCVMNPLLNNGCTYSNGNLEVAPPNNQSTHRLILGTHGIDPSDTNKYYWEIKYLASDTVNAVNMLGIGGIENPNNPASATLNGGGDGYGLGYNTSTSNLYRGSNWTANGSPVWTGGFTAGAIYGVAYDGSTKRLYFYENDTALNSGNHFATYTGSAFLTPGASLYHSSSSTKLIFNLGANGFTYTPPTGYVALNTSNLFTG